MKRILLIIFLYNLLFFASAQSSTDEQHVRQVINTFFNALEKQDTATFYNLHMKGARFYIVSDRNDTIRTASRDISSFTFHKEDVLKERMRDTGVVIQIHDRIATVWAPYDIWVNDKFSHCGIDAFTLLKTPEGWKISSCSYTVETKGCK
jgi:hypothetical protein